MTPRGRCPGLRRPMATGDGLLARLHPPGGRLTLAQARAVAEAAEACGNGHLEVTGRGNLQIRGVRADAHAELVRRIDGIGLLEAREDGPYRLTVVSPLAGVDPSERSDAAALAEAIECAAAAIPGLPAKTLVAVDGGGAFPLDEVEADLRFTAVAPDRIAMAAAAEGGPLWLGAMPVADAPEAAGELLREIAALARAGRMGRGRVRALPPEVRARLAAVVTGFACDVRGNRKDAVRPPAFCPRAGAIRSQPGRSALLAGLPFGRCEAAQLAALAAIAERAGAGELRLSFTRGILIPAISDAHLPAALDAVARLGLIVDPHDPRLAVAACPGGPACASGLAPAQADAARFADAARALVAAGLSLHVSGCPKGCAQPRPADLTLVARDDGDYAVVLSGTARDPADLHLPADVIVARLAALASPRDPAAAFGGAR